MNEYPSSCLNFEQIFEHENTKFIPVLLYVLFVDKSVGIDKKEAYTAAIRQEIGL